MFKNCFYSTKTNIIHLWEQINGVNLYTEIPWTPYVFIEDDTENSNIFSLNGDSVVKKDFSNYYDYYQYQLTNPYCYENKVRQEIQYLTERYHGIPDDEIVNPKLKTFFIDIEVHVEKGEGFPKAEEAKAPVVLISVYDSLNNKTTEFGLKPYNGKYKDEKWLNYIHCKNEDVLLIQFFNFINDEKPDIITGWNCIMFDLQYLVNRSKNIFGEKNNVYNKLSPINVVRTWLSKDDDFNIDIAGVTVLDYLDLFKWYSPKKLERYTLNYVANYVLEKGKVDYSEYNDLTTLYHQNWDLYVEYNIIDSLRVSQIEDKLGYIKMVQSLSLLTKVPMKFYDTQTTLIEGVMLTYFRRNNLCAPTMYGGVQEGFPAAIVKEPYPGLHDWVIDLDIRSSYPSAIITLNMSIETYYGRILNFTEDQVMFHVANRKFPEFEMLNDGGKMSFTGKKLENFNKALERKILCIAPCGSIFSTTTPGKIATVERNIFEKRKEVKRKMIELKKTLVDFSGDELDEIKEKINRYNGLQNALKTILNSMYGATSVPYSRYFNINLAEGIVSCGRQTILSGERIVNELLNNPNDELLNLIEEIKNA